MMAYSYPWHSTQGAQSSIPAPNHNTETIAADLKQHQGVVNAATLLSCDSAFALSLSFLAGSLSAWNMSWSRSHENVLSVRHNSDWGNDYEVTKCHCIPAGPLYAPQLRLPVSIYITESHAHTYNPVFDIWDILYTCAALGRSWSGIAPHRPTFPPYLALRINYPCDAVHQKPTHTWKKSLLHQVTTLPDSTDSCRYWRI